MEVLRSGFRHGVEDQDIQHALRTALLVEEIDDDPTRYLVLGPDKAGNMLELIVLDRPQGARGDARDDDESQVPAAAGQEIVTMPQTHGTKADGTPITDEVVEQMADEAERGYDVAEIRRRRGGRPPMGSAAASVESVRLDPELRRELLLRAAEEKISVSEAIRRAIGQYVRVG